MPEKIPGRDGSWYAPGTRKGNAGWAWRGKRPDGTWTELVTHEVDHARAQTRVREALEQWHRHTPPASGAAVGFEIAAHHYQATLSSDEEKARVDRLVSYFPKIPVGAINQSHVTAAAAKFRAERAALKRKQKYPPPSAATINREITTPLRAIVRFAAAQQWRPLIVLSAVRPAQGERPRPPRPAASDADVETLKAAIARAIGQCKPTARGRERAAIRRSRWLRSLFALVTVVHERGYRISEWLRWEWDTVDLTAAKASILLSKPDRWTSFDLSEEAVAALSALDDREAGRVFRTWHDRSAVYRAVDEIAPEGVRWRPHESRRAVVTAVLRNTGDPEAARQYISHANIKTTLRYARPEPVTPSVRKTLPKGR